MAFTNKRKAEASFVMASLAPAHGGQGGQPPTLEKIRVGHAHPGNINHGLKTFRQ